jgi:hypothetical protein
MDNELVVASNVLQQGQALIDREGELVAMLEVSDRVIVLPSQPPRSAACGMEDPNLQSGTPNRSAHVQPATLLAQQRESVLLSAVLDKSAVESEWLHDHLEQHQMCQVELKRELQRSTLRCLESRERHRIFVQQHRERRWGITDFRLALEEMAMSLEDTNWTLRQLHLLLDQKQSELRATTVQCQSLRRSFAELCAKASEMMVSPSAVSAIAIGLAATSPPFTSR